MQSFLLSALVATSTILSSTFAQDYPAVNVSSIDINVRTSWCNDQVTSCKLLCQNQNLGVASNLCYPENLYFQCLCSSGVTPNITEYSQTIPYFECTLSVEGCVNNCNGDSTCQSACTANKPCGASNPTRVNTTSTSTASSKTSATGTSSVIIGSNGYAVTGTSSASTGNSGSGSGSSGAARIIEAGSVYGMGLLVAGMGLGVAIVGF
jgi:hypothetical protein